MKLEIFEELIYENADCPKCENPIKYAMSEKGGFETTLGRCTPLGQKVIQCKGCGVLLRAVDYKKAE